MLLSELIKKLQEFFAKEGNLDVECWQPSGDSDSVDEVTLIADDDDDEEPVIFIE